MNDLFGLLAASCTVVLLAVCPALSADVVWEGTVKISHFECGEEGNDKIVIRNMVTLVHPEDKAVVDEAKRISIVCPFLQFDNGSSLNTLSALDIRIGDTTSGPVVIINTRGVRGKDGANPPHKGNDPAEDIWARKVGAEGEGGDDGQNGRDGSGCDLVGGYDSEPGGNGSVGLVGQDGGELGVARGESGQDGSSAADVILISRKFGEETTIDITANGGDGGNGGTGGRGADGGRGGRGGNGGRGGEASACHAASQGGDGKPGGPGGNGGDGGTGGDGGSGGNGGSVTILAEEGGPVPEVVVTSRGGRGGRGGFGGEPGAGGPGGDGGLYGPGGHGHKGLVPGIDDHSEGGPGINGGQGDPGTSGLSGLVGRDGFRGRIGRETSGFVTAEQLKDLSRK